MNAFFRHERHNGRWCPTVYYDDKPKPPKGEEERFTSFVSVPADCMSDDGSPLFGRLQSLFPAPVAREDDPS